MVRETALLLFLCFVRSFSDWRSTSTSRRTMNRGKQKVTRPNRQTRVLVATIFRQNTPIFRRKKKSKRTPVLSSRFGCVDDCCRARRNDYFIGRKRNTSTVRTYFIGVITGVIWRKKNHLILSVVRRRSRKNVVFKSTRARLERWRNSSGRGCFHVEITCWIAPVARTLRRTILW